MGNNNNKNKNAAPKQQAPEKKEAVKKEAVQAEKEIKEAVQNTQEAAATENIAEEVEENNPRAYRVSLDNLPQSIDYIKPKKSSGAVGSKTANNIINILLVIGCLTVFFPLYMTIVIALKKPSEMTNDVAGALGLPSSFSLANFKEAMEVTDFWHSLGNSLILTGVTVVLCILIHSIAGYAIGRKMAKNKLFKASYYYIVSGMFVPFAVLMMPLVKQTAQMGIANRVGVIILYVVFFMPMNMMLYTGYLKNIPTALEEAAFVDGANSWQTYWKIIFPNMKPMHATVAVLTAMSTWNDVMTPLVIMSGTDQNTLPLAQLNFQTQFGTNYNLAFASYLLALLPILIFYIICQKQILNGVVNGAVK
jgi:raffinose/stachyose/melibiose transport system permease protein